MSIFNKRRKKRDTQISSKAKQISKHIWEVTTTDIKAEHDIPSTLELECSPLNITAEKNEDGTSKVSTFKMVANTGEPMKLAGFVDPVIIDIEGFESKQTIPALKDHKTEVGHTTVISKDLQKFEITAEGKLSVPNAESEQIRASAKEGFPWQASVGADIKKIKGKIQASFLEEGERATVNGKEWEGPLIIAHKTVGKELTITKLGADSNTSVSVAALRKKEITMNEFDKWLEAGYSGIDFSDEQKVKLKAKFDAEVMKDKDKGKLEFESSSSNSKDKRLEAAKEANELEAAREERLDAFDTITAQYSDRPLNATYLKEELGIKGTTIRALKSHAIRNDWSKDKFELACSKAERQDMGEFSIHSKEQRSFNEDALPAISAAMVMNSTIPASEKVITSGCLSLSAQHQTTKTIGYEHIPNGVGFKYDDKTLEASEKWSEYSLCMLLDQANVQAGNGRYSGKLGSDGFQRFTQDSLMTLKIQAAGSGGGNTTWSGLTIFDDVANKMLWAAYEAIATTWQRWVQQENVSDFKTGNIYRMHMDGGYQQVAADGMLTHGGMSNDKYTHSADTYGKIVGMNRKDIINDDLGALNTIMKALGVEGARFLEELFYVQLLTNLTTLFPVADENGNYIDGATSDLTIDGLTRAEQKFVDQVQDDAPIGIMSNLLLVGSQDSVIGGELFTKDGVRVAQTVDGLSKDRPDGNPHLGKFAPVVSGYLNNTAIKQRITRKRIAVPNQTSDQWLVLPNASSSLGAIIIGSFLNGNVRPTIQQGDPAFDILGLRWRAFQDAGADNGDPKLGVYSKGAA